MDNSILDFTGNVNLSDKELYQKIWGGKHISPWFFIRSAVRSSLMCAVNGASMWLAHYHRAKSRCKSPAELALISGISYAKLIPGPHLSTILLSAASIEAFARHSFVSTLRTKTRHKERQALDDKFFQFDNSNTTQRLQMLVAELIAVKLPKPIITEVDDLFIFRNSVMHGDPLYHPEDFRKPVRLASDKKKLKTVEKGPRDVKYYPDLTEGNCPLNLTHSLRATVAHDKLVEHIIGTSECPDAMGFLNEIEMTKNDKGLIWGDPTFTLVYSQANLIATEMSSIKKELDNVSIKEKLQFVRKLKK